MVRRAQRGAACVSQMAAPASRCAVPMRKASAGRSPGWLALIRAQAGRMARSGSVLADDPICPPAESRFHRVSVVWRGVKCAVTCRSDAQSIRQGHHDVDMRAGRGLTRLGTDLAAKLFRPPPRSGSAPRGNPVPGQQVRRDMSGRSTNIREVIMLPIRERVGVVMRPRSGLAVALPPASRFCIVAWQPRAGAFRAPSYCWPMRKPFRSHTACDRPAG